ncbi:DUF4439 domain-containing protein [Luteococcus peritonei]|uniref:DUF4439 domain-containing protein n=1 Tax=Luteococcus peritonei TaxID=88874 RepID=A0ABW4RXG1_9ACTN
MPTSRRALLGLSLAAGLAGCAPDPTVGRRHSQAGPAPAAAMPQAALLAASRAEQQMADWLAGVAAGAPGNGAPAPVLTAMATSHAAHAQLLARPEPLSPATTTPAPTARPTAVRTAWKALAPQLAAREDALVKQHSELLARAEDASQALLLCSLAAFAAGHRSPGSAPAEGRLRPAMVEVGSPEQARLALLSQLRALAEGLEVGAGQVDPQSPEYERGKARLAQVWQARDALIRRLAADGTTVPPAELSYAMPGDFASPAAVRRTWAALENGVLAGWARVCAATTGTDRSQALSQVLAQTAQVRADGGALGWWPGWV